MFDDRVLRARIDAVPAWPCIEQEFLTADVAHTIATWLDLHHQKFGSLGEFEGDQYWRGRSLHYHQVNDAQIQSIMRDCRSRVISKIQEILMTNLGVSDTVHGEYLGFARWPEGYELRPHADSEQSNGEPHPFAYRNFAAVVYFNQDFDGGEIYFPNQGIMIKPEIGAMAVFPGTLNYLHGVRKITRGMRHTLAMFMTLNPEKRDNIA